MSDGERVDVLRDELFDDLHLGIGVGRRRPVVHELRAELFSGFLAALLHRVEVADVDEFGDERDAELLVLSARWAQGAHADDRRGAQGKKTPNHMNLHEHSKTNGAGIGDDIVDAASRWVIGAERY
jgi:hypothetical protein